MNNKCPKCGSEDIDQTGKMDAGFVNADECRHDFECLDCECLFTITYAPIYATIIAANEDELENGPDANNDPTASDPTADPTADASLAIDPASNQL